MKPFTIDLEGCSYTWNGRSWFDSRTYHAPPAALASKLNELLASHLAIEDAAITDFNGLLRIAQVAREASQYKRAEVALRRAIQLEPSSEAAFAILCSVLRHLGASDRAIRETQHLSSSRYSPLVVSRAAAFCDLEEWEKAKSTLSRALAMGDSPEAFGVMNRIKANRPDLYEKETARTRRR